MGEYSERQKDYSFRDFPDNPEDGQEFIIKDNNGHITVHMYYDAGSGQWKPIHK